MNASISPAPVSLKAIANMREAYRRELSCQIVHDSHHERGFLRSHAFVLNGALAGYGSINDSGTVKEFYIIPAFRDATLTLFRMLIDQTRASAIEAQSNDSLLMPMMQAYATDVTAKTILFEDGGTTALMGGGAIFRKLRWYERPFVFEHRLEPVGDFAIEVNGRVVATGGLMFHYNPPYGDVHMEVAAEYRRRGLGAFLVQELRRVAREGGHVPAARCSVDNAASQATLRRAGMRPCAQILRGEVAA